MRFRWIIIGLSVLWSGYMLLHPPEEGEGSWSDYKQNLKNNVRLGLDLQGGIFMQLQVDEDDAVAQYLEEQAGLIKGSLPEEDFTVQGSFATVDQNMVTLQGAKAKGEKSPLDFLDDRYDVNWIVRQRGDDIELVLRDRAVKDVKDEAVNQTVYKIQSRVDELGVTEPVINRTLGSNRIVVELAGADDSNRVEKIVREPGQLEWRLVVPNTKRDARSEAELISSLGRPVRPTEKIMPYAHPRGETFYLLMQEVMLTAKNVADVFPTADENGLPAVGINLDRAGGLIMSDKSGANVGQSLAIVLDGKVVSAPTIQSKLGERFIIMGLSQSEVPDLIVKIKSGSLPAQVKILESRSIGPTLGRDAIASGSRAAILGLILVMVFIAVYYRGAGLIALVALVLNLILIMGMLAGIGAVLTLPGIAGFILTIGMAVDANVLIFERIREELNEGIMPKNAVEVGYKSAFVTIMDANLTTFIAAFILYLEGEGPVKGFAVMLMIGIICSIFTAVFCSRTFFMWVIQRNPSMKKLSIWPLWSSGQANAN